MTNYLKPVMRGHAEGRVVDLPHEVIPTSRVRTLARKIFFDTRFSENKIDT